MILCGLGFRAGRICAVDERFTGVVGFMWCVRVRGFQNTDLLV